MIKKNTLTPLLLAGIFVFMLGLSFAAVPLYDLFCRVTGFGGTTQISKEAPKIVLDKIVNWCERYKEYKIKRSLPKATYDEQARKEDLNKWVNGREKSYK